VSDPNRFQRLLTNTSQALKEGARKSEQATRIAEEVYPSVLNVAGKYHKALRAQGVSLKETPVQAIGAFGTRLVTDLTNDGTRGVYWRYNHPLAILDTGIENTMKAVVGKDAYRDLGKTKTGLMAATVAIPTTIMSGAFNILNPGQAFRATGYAQTYSPEGTDDRRETEQPVQELFDRFFLGRQGPPLKYETAKAEIPSLTPERYSRFMQNYYQDRGFMGILKATPENLEGIPEARMLGYPVNIATATTAIGGLAGLAAGVGSAPSKVVPGTGYREHTVDMARTGLTRRGLIGGATGALAGAAIGSVINATIAQANRPKLPTVAEYTEEMQ
jgi:hypothetical protein